MDEENCFHENILERWKLEIRKRIQAIDLVDHIRDLTEPAKQKIRCISEHKGTQRAAEALYDEIKRLYSDAFVDFVEAVNSTPGLHILAMGLYHDVPEKYKYKFHAFMGNHAEDSAVQTGSTDFAPDSGPINAVQRRPKLVKDRTITNDLEDLTEDFAGIPNGIQLYAAIDFGTSYSGYAYRYANDMQNPALTIHTPIWQLGAGQSVVMETPKTPTCVLFNEDLQFHSFGYQAENTFFKLSPDEATRWLFFDKFKMTLYQPESLGLDTVMHAKNGNSIPAMEVFAAAIRFLKDHLLQTLKDRERRVDKDNIQFVLTVPAIWEEKSKQFMRKAAEKAGISGARLVLALEPEVGSIYCRRLPIENLNIRNSETLRQLSCPGSKFLVVDLGGGTVDVTAYHVGDDTKLQEIYLATGGPWGGCMVDRNFFNLVTHILGKRFMLKVLHNTTTDLELRRELELRKRTLEPGVDDWTAITVPEAILEIAKDGLAALAKSLPPEYHGKVEFSIFKIKIKNSLLEKLFLPCLEKITEHLKMLLTQDPLKDLDKILLIGGFANSRVVKQYIRKMFPSLEVIIPEDAGLAVLKGAVLFGQNPNVVSQRIVRYTIGSNCFRKFDPSRHPEEKKIVEGDTVLCKDLFRQWVGIGQKILLEAPAITISYSPLQPNAEEMTIGLYASSDSHPNFVTDESCTKLGEVRVCMPDLRGDTDRRVTIRAHFHHTEMYVEAEDLNTRRTFDVTVDLLPDIFDTA